MKTEEEVKKQLEDIYNHRLNLRMQRKLKMCCRNCKHGITQEFDLGDFGLMKKWQCKEDKKCSSNCGFECLYTAQEIQEQMIRDISDPAICGAKEPKIAVLLWLLHNPDKKNENKENSSGILNFIKGIFR